MPLDTQPLSRGRRLVMIGVLAGLFAGSLGFAEYLVVRRSGGVEVGTRLEKFGFTTRESPSLEYEVAARSGMVEERERLVEVFAWRVKEPWSFRQQTEEAEALFEKLTEEHPQMMAQERLLGFPAVEVAGKMEQEQFTIMRLAVIDRRVVAISYSGPLPYTDADKNTFNGICATGIELRK